MKRSLIIFSLVIALALSLSHNKSTNAEYNALIRDRDLNLLTLKSRMESIETKIDNVELALLNNIMDVNATAYTLDPAECDADPELSAFGLSNYAQIAVSKDLIDSGAFRPGDNVLIKFKNGKHLLRVVNDRLNRRFRNRIDILFKSKKKALEFGFQHVTIINLDRANEQLRMML